MEYNVNTEDVSKYLEELKQYIFTIGESSGTGTANLSVLLNALKNDIATVKQRATEDLQFFMQRYNKVTAMLSSLEYSKKYEDNIDYRYDFYKKNTQNIVTFSGFMMLTNLQLDESFKAITAMGAELRREQHSLEILIEKGNSYVLFIEEFEPELEELINKCNSI